MIPYQLKLRNFLSYKHQDLDFSGLHVVGICGANGAGKSALLEAMGWAIWGKSRVSTQEEIIYLGATEAQVDFAWIFNGNLFRVIRTRTRGKGVDLQWQTRANNQWRSLTGKNVKETESAIIQTLRMDYDTFINSAYLRQGMADEFMLKTAKERKQILAEILNLEIYEQLAERAKEQESICKAQVQVLSQEIERLGQQIDSADERLTLLPQLQSQRHELLAQVELDRQQWQNMQAMQQQRAWHRQQQTQITQELEQLQPQIDSYRQQFTKLQELLRMEPQISRDYQHYQHLAQQEKYLSEKQLPYQQLTHQYQTLQMSIERQRQELQLYLRQYQQQLAELHEHQQELQAILIKAPEIESALEQYQQARLRLEALTKLQMQANPLLQRRQEIISLLDRHRAKLTAQLEELQRQQQAGDKSHLIDQLRHDQQAIAEQIAILQKKQVYQQRVHEKGLERRDFLERIKARQENCQQRLMEINTKFQALQQGEMTVCPLCDRPLDQFHVHHLQEQCRQEEKELQAELWVLKEQQATSECEIQVLRQEYKELQVELENLPKLLNRQGVLTAELEAQQQAQSAQQQRSIQIQQLQHQLAQNHISPEHQTELELLDRSLAQLNFDDKDLALARGDCDRWRWAEVKYSELKNARKQWEQMASKAQELQNQIQQIQERLGLEQIAPAEQQELMRVQKALQKLAYDPQQHQHILQEKEQMTPALLRWQDLMNGKQQYPLVQNRLEQVYARQQALQQRLTEISHQLQSYDRQLAELPPLSQLEQNIQERNRQLETLLAQIGSLQALQQERQNYYDQKQQLEQQKADTAHRQFLYKELKVAYGKDGIQALTIEHLLPQIEAEANRILAQLSDQQFTLRFITQTTNQKGNKTIETLDIQVADARGTRAYETYSGGEAFRINFAMRLAFARVLSQRQGCTLQTLIIDEGFGSQDREGCQRLLSAINAIAHEFACILVVTHVPQLQEAFSTVIEVTKTPDGSKIQLKN